MELTRPVSSAYNRPAAVMFVADAPGKFAAVNRPLAGSVVSVSKLTLGTSVWFFAQMSYCVNDPPKLRLWRPFSHVSVSSTSRLFALRDCGAGAGPGLVNAVLIVGNRSEK